MFPISDSTRSPRFPFLNITLIVFTSLVFVMQIFSPNPNAFVSHYALIPTLINFNDFSTLTPFITAIFLHGGFLHILSNMWFLWVFGDNVEDKLGFFLFILLYFVSGVVGNLLQFLLMASSPIPMLGASGAIAGVLGAYYVLFPKAKIKTFIPLFGLPAVIQIPASFMLGYWFVLQLVSGTATFPFSETTGGVAFFAHIGGFLTGIFLAKLSRK